MTGGGSISADAFLDTPNFGAAFEALPKRALIVARDGRVLAANRAWSQQDAPGPATIGDAFEGETDALIKGVVRDAGGGWSVMTPRSSEKPQTFKILPLRSGHGRTTQFMLFEYDRRSKNYGFAALNRRLAENATARERKNNRSLQRNFDQMERFAYVAAHDLRAPLRNIASLLEYLEEDFGETLPEGAQSLLNSARTASMRLQSMISELLAHARSGSGEVRKTELNVRDVVKEITDSLASDFIELDARLDTETDLGTIQADPRLFRQLMQNLIGNALKYRSIERSPVIRIDRGRTFGELAIRDNGVGFRQQFAQQIFEPFQRLHSASEIEGSGIGLATCAAIAQRHGWTIRAEGVPGEGATFILEGIG